jgi:hypothetical protein
MANSYTSQIIKDTTEHVVIKLTASFDGTGQESNATRIVANTLYGAIATNGYLVANSNGGSANTTLSYYGLALNRLWYDCGAGGDVTLVWGCGADSANQKTLIAMNGNGEFDGMGNWTTIPNNANPNANCKGDIGVITRGMAANDSYTMIVELRKNNAHYQRGQFNDPAAFNYGAYSLEPHA